MSSNEEEFGYRVRQALNESLPRLDCGAVQGLAQARANALARHKAARTEPAWIAQPTAAVATIDPDNAAARWWHRFGVLLPLVLLAAAFFLVAEWHHARGIRDQAHLDFAVLMDETPIDAVADQGFGVFLQTGDVPTPKE